MKVKIIAFSLCLCSVTNIVFAQRTIAGCYKTNFADLGFFGTDIRLNQDSTFYYRFAGDLIFKNGIGTYFVKHDTIYLVFNKKIKFSTLDSLLFNTIQTEDKRFLFKHGKLFFVNITTGKLVTKGSGYSKRKKYLLWGSHYRMMRFYLQRFPCEKWFNYEPEYEQLRKLIQK